MEDHPADGLLETLKNTFNGEGFKQTLRDAWDRLHGDSQPAAGSHDAMVKQMNDQANAQSVQNATKTFIKPDVAAKIRKQAAK